MSRERVFLTPLLPRSYTKLVYCLGMSWLGEGPVLWHPKVFFSELHGAGAV